MKKVLALTACAAMLVTTSVMGTLAYLTSTTQTVKNTFTVGKVEISLDEAQVDEYGVAVTPGSRVKENDYKMIPGHEYKKDPTIYVSTDSKDCYVFVKVENDIEAYESTVVGKSIADQMGTLGWKAVTGQTDVYYYDGDLATYAVVEGGITLKVFETFTIATEAETVAGWGTAVQTVEVTAYAIQVDGIAGDTLEAKIANAWTAVSTH